MTCETSIKEEVDQWKFMAQELGIEIAYVNLSIGAGTFQPVKVDSIKISNRVMKLDKNKELYIIGEGYSEKQSWVEGALENCEKFLKKYKIICK